MSAVKRQRRAITATAIAVVVGVLAASPLPPAHGLDPLDRRTFMATDVVDQAQLRSITAPSLPATAASNDPASIAAGDALWALWYDDPTYEAKLDALVPMIAFRALVPPDQLAAAWKVASKQRMVVVLSALTQLGVPYRRFKSEVGIGFDCSGLTAWAWAQVGLNLPHQSLRQMRVSTIKDRNSVLPGDLLYYPGHIMLALGAGNGIIHAPYTGSRVEVRPMMRTRVNSFRVGSPIG